MAEEITFVFSPTPTQIGTLTVDATIRGDHSLKADTTDHPMDDGYDITDGVIFKNPEFTMDGMISTRQTNGRVTDAYAKIEALLGKPLTLITSMKRYDNMIMKELTLHQAPNLGGVLGFTATFKQSRFATAATVEIIDDPRGKKPGDHGDQPTKPAGPAKNKSALKQGSESKTFQNAKESAKKAFAKVFGG